MYRAWPTQTDVLYGLAVTSFKLGQYGDAALFAERGLKLTTARERFYYLLAATRRILGQIPEATSFYSKLLSSCQLQAQSSFQPPQVDTARLEDDLFSALRSSAVRFFARFSDNSLKELLKESQMQRRSQGSLLILEREQACVMLSGQVCVRSHAGSAIYPTVLWQLSKVYSAAGDFLTFEQNEVVGSAEVWSRFETDSSILLLLEKKLNELLRKERVTQKDILVKTLQAFPLFTELHLSTLELLVYDLMEVRNYNEGEVVQRQLSGPCEEPFQILLAGLCSLQVSSINYEAAFLGRGDFFCEEALMQGQRGFASAGDIIAKSKVEVARIPPACFYKLPAYEVKKMQERAAAKGQVEFVLHRIEKQRLRLKHVRRNTSL